MVTLLAAGAAYAQGYQSPNSTVGVGVGTPWLASVRGAAWVGDEVSFDLGVGTLGLVDQNLGFDTAAHWRPDFACFGCEGRVLATVGLGVGGIVTSDIDLSGGPAFDDPWAFAVGPDLVATGTYWLTPTIGLMASGRVGIGAAWVGDDFSEIGAGTWAFLTAGLAF